MRRSSPDHGLTLFETVISAVLIAVLLSILLPMLTSARMASYREQCASNQQQIGEAWAAYLDENNRQFPFIHHQPGWMYGGVRFSSTSHEAYPDTDRPLTPYLSLFRTGSYEKLCVCCPGDRGIVDPQLGVVGGHRTTFRSYGTSYRANAVLMDVRLARGLDVTEPRGMRRDEIVTFPSRMVLLGDPVWYEVAESTGRNADWHGVANAGNVLFLDGSVRFATNLAPREKGGPVAYDPLPVGVTLESP